MNTNQSTTSKSIIIPTALKTLLCRFAYYFDGNLNRFCLGQNNELTFEKSDVTNSTLPLVIVARSHYQELAKTYPIENKTELKKLLALELTENELSFSKIADSKEGQTSANIWHFHQSVPKAFITLPESLLLSLINQPGQIAQVEGNQTLFVGQNNGVVHSAIANSMINSVPRFAMSTGVVNNDELNVFTASNLAMALASGIKASSFSLFSSFVKLKSTFDKEIFLKQAVVPFAVIFSSYLILSSSYLLGKQYWLEQQLTSQSSEVNAVLAEQQLFDNNQQRFEQLTAFYQDKKNSAQLWLVLAELFEHANFSNFRIDNQRFVLRGSTEQATDLLARVSNIAKVKDAKFDYPTRNSRGKDVFVISFIIEGES
ncbi:hypothetical protein [Thalassotalea castellviae]|uniref:GspL cytoplasmic actin-ATPase-like domain-containing protein n=1 Tax=Thalassotalea castellviae TaxID=3075612 RepID=A0ABU2ZY21_9GAMM|nr:hypothetical protein [Thalassotalea sp. W431]MDT0602812.1 hypothetical protein [Thalassotalea sp. W431]